MAKKEHEELLPIGQSGEKAYRKFDEANRTHSKVPTIATIEQLAAIPFSSIEFNENDVSKLKSCQFCTGFKTCKSVKYLELYSDSVKFAHNVESTGFLRDHLWFYTASNCTFFTKITDPIFK